MAIINPSRLAIACVFSALFGISMAVTTIVALGLSVPLFLLDTADTISISYRALGGSVGITIFTLIFNNKFATHLRQYVPAVVSEIGFGPKVLDKVFRLIASPNPASLPTSSSASQLIGAIEGAITEAKNNSWTYVWVAVACLVTANAVAACFLKSVAPKMNHHVKSVLEKSEVREAQLHNKSVI